MKHETIRALSAILVPVRHHLSKVPGTEAKTALKAVNQALELLSQTTEPTFVVVQNPHDRIVAIPDSGCMLDHNDTSDATWRSVKSWTFKDPIFMEVLKVISRVAAGEPLK